MSRGRGQSPPTSRRDSLGVVGAGVAGGGVGTQPTSHRGSLVGVGAGDAGGGGTKPHQRAVGVEGRGEIPPTSRRDSLGAVGAGIAGGGVGTQPTSHRGSLVGVGASDAGGGRTKPHQRVVETRWLW
jgi:hypothetical protein